MANGKPARAMVAQPKLRPDGGQSIRQKSHEAGGEKPIQSEAGSTLHLSFSVTIHEHENAAEVAKHLEALTK